MSGEEPPATRARNRVSHLATSDWPEALRLARSIHDPWFRCQALSTVAEHSSQAEQRRTLLAEAFEAAAGTADPNRIVSVSAWPLEVLAKHDPQDALGRLERLRRTIDAESHPVRRLDAMFWVAWLLRDGPDVVFLTATDHFIALAREGHGWKRDRDLKELAVWLAQRGDVHRPGTLLGLIEKPRIFRQALREIAGA